jgi:glycosyltransferase involved in cell wall biosynthesis
MMGAEDSSSSLNRDLDKFYQKLVHLSHVVGGPVSIMAFVFNRRSGDANEAQAPKSAPGVQQLLSTADAARDARRWNDAAQIYGEYLGLRPEDAPIWVQLGHALKESGNLGDAEGAYKRSLELVPDVADTQLQLGHLYKQMRRFSHAITAYREALRIDGTLFDARRELTNLHVSAGETFSTERSALLREPGTFIDLSDVFSYLHHHPTVSGIQRVQLGIANAIIAMPPEERSGMLFLSEADDRRDYAIIDDVFVTELSKELSRDEVEHARLIEVIRSATRLGRTYEPVEGDTLLLVGAFWVLQNIVERIIALKRLGVRIGTFVHDLIPITHPEFCERPLTEVFKAYVFRVLSLTDFIITFSDHSGRQVHEFFAKNNLPQIPIETVRSAHKTWEASRRPGTISPAIARLTKEEYVLYVSTIEIRKNHIYLFRIWKRLIAQLGKDVPHLVFVGRPGWRVNDLMEQLKSTNNLNGNMILLHNLSDTELATLYKAALFTVFPSFVEGWGLPVGESLMFGRPCIASTASSVPEVAGDFVEYVDPLNDHDGYEKIRRFIEDREFLEQRARQIQNTFRPREWGDVATDLISTVQSIVSNGSAPGKLMQLPCALPGHIYRLGHGDDASRFVESGDSEFAHFACDTGWDRVEGFGRWLRDRTARLEFLIGQGADQPIQILLGTYTVDWLGSMHLQITANGTDYPPLPLERGIRRFLLLHVIPNSGRVVLEFNAIGDIAAGPDERTYLWLGLGALGYAPRDDALARVLLLEELLSSVSNIVALRPKQTS